jgi:hypothetical protein
MSRESVISVQTCRFGEAKKAIAGELGNAAPVVERGTISGTCSLSRAPSDCHPEDEGPKDPSRSLS